jgi:hypothetical protein
MLIRLQTVKVLLLGLALLALASAPVATIYGQDVTAGMAGTVTDQSGAAVPNATVTLINTTTGLRYTETTNSIGYYRFTNIPPGQGYEASFTAKGFSQFNVKDIYLTVNTVRTQNATLNVGTQVATVEVTAAGSEVTIDTSDATVGNNIDVQQLNELPAQQRGTPTALFELQAGVTDTGSVTGARVDQNYITVDGLDMNDLGTGGYAYNSSPNGVQEGIRQLTLVSGAPIDSVEQFTGSVAGNEADAGPGSGGQFALITKGGTNHFHGNLNEYHRDTALVANSWFSNNADPIVPRNNLIQNQFGGNIGGPIKRDRLFFFFDFNDDRLVRSALQQRTVPLDNMRNGNIGFINNASTPSAPQITYLTPSQVASLDPRAVGEDATWMTAFDSRFPHSNNSNSGDGVNSGGYLFNAPDNDDVTTYVSRVDYNINDKMKAFAKFSINREDGVYNPNQFAGDPATSEEVDRSYSFVIGHTWVPNTTMTNRLILGEVVQKLGFAFNWNPSWIPQESTSYTFADGTGPALVSPFYLSPNAQARRVPIPVVADDFSWIKGSHTWQIGGSFKDILAHFTNVADYNVTYVGMGGEILNLCGPNPGDCGTNSFGMNNPSLRPAGSSAANSIYVAPSNATQAQSGLQNLADYDWDQAFTFMLARIGNVQEDFNYNKNGNALKQLTGDQRFYRSYQAQLYLQDNWKINPDFTLDYGLNYQYYSVPYETRGLESVEPFTFDQYFQARVQQSAESQSGPLAVPLIAYYLGGKGNGSGAPPLYTPERRLIAPHLGFAWNPGFDKKLVINGSGSIAYDRTVIFAIQQIQDADSYLFQQTLPVAEGISGDPYDSVKNDPRLDSKNDISLAFQPAPPTPKAPYEPYVTGGVPIGLNLGTAFNATIDPSLKTPYNIVYNFGIQRALPGNMVLKASYVGRLGRRLIAQADANQVIDFADPASGQLYSQAFASIVKQVRAGATSSTVTPQPWFEDMMAPGTGTSAGFANNTQFVVANIGGYVYRGDFADSTQFMSYFVPANVGMGAQFSENTFYTNKGFSSYNGLLLTVQKNLSNGLQYDFNYTFAHSIDNVSLPANSEGDTGIGGVGLICDVVRPRECRADSDFDVRHYITADAIYQLPFGRGKMFLGGASTLVNELLGQWSLSGITIFHTGQAWGTVSNAFVASYSNDAPGILIGKKSDVATHITKLPGGGVNIFANQANAQNAFEGPIGFQIGPRNELHGPRYFNTDLGLGKVFPVYGEGVSLKFRADAFNAFNHPNFNLPANNVFQGYDQQDFTSSTFGEISTTVEPAGNLNNGARVLQLALRLEF